VSQVIVLDTGPLGLITNPKLSAEGTACAQWLQAQIASGSRVIIPEIADYEIRRELLRAHKAKGLARLDQLTQVLEYLPNIYQLPPWRCAKPHNYGPKHANRANPQQATKQSMAT
jgi:hypothetical protein